MKRGRKHHYWGMDMVLEERGKVKVSMVPYVLEIMRNFPEEIRILTAATLTAKNVFQVRNKQEAKSLPEE